MAKEAKLITLKNLERFGQGIQDQLGIDLQALETELKAFVGNKQITYLTQAEYDAMGDADKNDENRVFIITDKVEVESATKEAFDELQNSVNDVSGEVEALQGALANKAEKTDLNAYSTTEAMNQAIQTAIANKADDSDIEAINGQIGIINTALGNKLEASDLTSINQSITDLTTKFNDYSTTDEITGLLATKADQSALEALTGRVQANETFVASADTTYVKVADHTTQVEEINTAIGKKADQATVTTLSQTVESHATFVTNAPNTFAAKATVDEILDTALPAKADNTRVQAIEDARTAENTVSAVAVENGQALLTDRKLQKVTGLVNGTELVLPAATNFMEMRVFLAATEETNIVCSALADGLVLEANCVYELRFVHVDTMIGWLVSIIEFDTVVQ